MFAHNLSAGRGSTGAFNEHPGLTGLHRCITKQRSTPLTLIKSSHLCLAVPAVTPEEIRARGSGVLVLPLKSIAFGAVDVDYSSQEASTARRHQARPAGTRHGPNQLTTKTSLGPVLKELNYRNSPALRGQSLMWNWASFSFGMSFQVARNICRSGGGDTSRYTA